MKEKKKRGRISSLLVLLLVGLMGAGSACSGFLSFPKGSIPGGDAVSSEKPYILEHQTGVDGSKYLNEDLALDEELAGKVLKADDDIHLIIESGETSLFSLYEASNKTMTYQEFLGTRTARLNAENMYARQREIFKQISKKVDAEFRISYTGLINGFSIKIKYGDRELVDEVGYRAGILSSSVSEVYAKPEAEFVDNSIDCEETGIFTNSTEYQGEGMLIAVLDSGLDYRHPSFDPLINKDILPQKDGAVDVSKLALSKDSKDSKRNLVDMWPTIGLSAVSYPLAPAHLTVSDVYMTEKVPFAYDYADWDNEVDTTEDGMHGTHVSGIIVGQTPNSEILYKKKDGLNQDGSQKYIAVSTYSASEWNNGKGVIEADKNGNPKQYIRDKVNPDTIRIDDFKRDMLAIKGVAPRAQVVAMKVFSDYESGAQDDNLLSALQDCAALNVDVVNMSLGSASGFSDLLDRPAQQKAYEAIHKLGINLVVAAGNNASSARGGSFGTNLTSNPDSGTIGTPASLTQSYSVASIQGVKSKYISVKDSQDKVIGTSYFTEAGKTNGDRYDFIKDIIAAVKGINRYDYDYRDRTFISGGTTYKYYENHATRGEVIRVPYIIIPGLGKDTDFEGKGVDGKIAFIARGKTTFTEKINNARSAGALAAVIHNNVSGIISMAIEESEDPKNHIPACSVTMDSAASYKNVPGGYFEICATQEAGPFMSDFSSWGPLPNLQLKPEITGHGGEIYSASPGNNYARISGTSMACPNVAGLTLAMRQYLTEEIKKEEENAGSGKFGTMSTSEMQSLIYKLMMSTAKSPLDEFSIPYSPRKVGAGVADLNNMIKTDAYIYVDDTKKEYEFDKDGKRTGNFTLTPVKDKDGNKLIKEYTKLELFDDPIKKGEYIMDFYVKNVGGTALNYKPQVNVLTETVSSDRTYTTDASGNRVIDFEGTVAEKAHVLKPASTVFSMVTGTETQPIYTPVSDNITVPADGTVKVRLIVQLSQADKDYLNENFENGMYVEGFISLIDQVAGENKIDLNVPYLAYYGDWTKPPMLSYSIYETDPDDKDDNIYDKDKRRSQSTPLMAFGKYTKNNRDYTYPIGSYLWIYSELYFEGMIPEATEERTALSLSPESVYELYYLTGLQRPFKSFHYQVRDVVTGEIIHSGIKPNARKGGISLEISPITMGCRNGGTYRFEMSGYLDYLDGKQGTNNSWGFNFTVNTAPPVITDCEIRYEKRTSGTYGFDRYLDFYISSDHMVSAMSFNIWNKKTQQYENLYDKGMRPIQGGNNGVTKVSYNIDEFLWSRLKENDFLIQTEIFDWAVNSSLYRLDLKELLYTAAQELDLADIGLYREYKSGNNTINLLTDYVKEVVYDADGNYKSLAPEGGLNPNLGNAKTVYMLPNQNVELKYAVVATESFWEEDLVWNSSNPDVVSINKKTGEIYAKKGGTSLIKVESSKAKKTAAFYVEVLSGEKCEQYGISFYQKNGDGTYTIPAGKSATAARFTEDILNYYSRDTVYLPFDPGERYEVEIEVDPWFTKDAVTIDGQKLSDEEWAKRIKWTSYDTGAFVVDPGVNKYGLNVDNETGTTKVSPFAATIIAARGTFVNGVYTPPSGTGLGTAITVDINVGTATVEKLVSKTLYVGLRREFVVENSVLKEYHGDNQDYMPNKIKNNINDTRNYPTGTSSEKNDKKITNYQNIITNTSYTAYESFANGKGVGEYSLFPYDPKSWPQIEYHNTDPKWEGMQLKVVTGKDADGKDVLGDMPNGTLVDDIFKYKRLFSDLELRMFINNRGVIIDKYNSLCFKRYTYYQGYVEIPTNLNIRNIGRAVFMSNQHITRLSFPDGIQRIEVAACADMTALREVYFPYTIKAIEDWAFAAENDPVLGTTTSLHIVDFSRVIEPLAVGYAAFQNQEMLGVRNLVTRNGDFYIDNGEGLFYKSDAKDVPYQYYKYSHDPDAAGYLLTDAKGNPRYFDRVFDLSVVRLAARQAFYKITNVKYADLTNMSVMGVIAFGYFGRDAGSPPEDATAFTHKVKIITSSKTAIGSAAFYNNGINQPIEFNNKRITAESFLLSWYVPKMTFTANDLVIEARAFAICPLLEEIDFQGSVESIGSSAFEAAVLNGTRNGEPAQFSVSVLTKLKWSTVKRIEDKAFYDAVAITEITLPNGLQYIGNDAFAVNSDPKINHNIWNVFTSGLYTQAKRNEEGKYVDINGNVTDKQAEYVLNKGIETLIIPANFNSDIKFVLPFTSAVEFKKIEVESGNTMYESRDNILLKKSDNDLEIVLVPYGITTLTLPADLTKISAYAFAGNLNLTEIDLSACTGLTIGEGAFMNCQNLESVVLPDSMTVIPDYLFADSAKLDDITWNQAEVTQIGRAAFRNTAITGIIETPNLVDVIEFVKDDKGAIIKDEKGNDVFIVKTPAMGAEAFSGTKISSFNFDVATGLSYVASGAFSNCEEIIGDLILPNHIKTIRSNAFSASADPKNPKTSRITAVTGNGVTSIGDSAFENCNMLASIIFPNVETIGQYAFAAKGLTTIVADSKIDVPGVDIRNVQKIGFAAFYGQSKLTQFGERTGGKTTHGKGLTKLTEIDAYAFGYTGITSFAGSFPALKTIGNYAFIGNTGLVTVNIHANVQNIGIAAFAGATKLTGFTVASQNTKFTAIEGVLFKNVNDGINIITNEGGTAIRTEVKAAALELVQYPSGGYRQWTADGKTVTEKSKLYNVPEGTVRIAHRAFWLNTHLKNVQLPTTLKAIGDGAFFESEVRSYVFLSLSAPILESWFSGLNRTDAGDEYGHYWGVYSNFVGYFNPTVEMLTYKAPDNEEDTFEESDKEIIGADESRYMYSGITTSYYTDQFPLINKSINGQGFTGTDFGLSIEFPGNGIGYNNFVYSNYFSRRIPGEDALLDKTKEVIEMIRLLARLDDAKLTVLLADLVAVKNELKPLESELRAANKAHDEAKEGIDQNLINSKKDILDEVQGRYNIIFEKLNQAQLAADAIPAARESYEILSLGQKKLVNNYAVLEAAEERYAKVFTGLRHTVTYINDNKIFARQFVDNDVITLMPENIPELEWHTFIGWYLDGAPYDFNTPITGDLALYAVFHRATFTVAFEDSSIADAKVLAGEALERPEDPTKKKYVFKGWYLGDEEYDFATQVTSDITLTAKWEKDGSCGSCGTVSTDFNAGTLVALLTMICILAAVSFAILKKRGKNKM